MRMDPGFPRRFPRTMHLTDYTAGDIAEIAVQMAKGQNKECEAGLTEKLAKHIASFYRREMPEQNAGLAKNLVEAAITQRAARLAESGTKIEEVRERAREAAVAEPAAESEGGLAPVLSATVTDRARELLEDYDAMQAPEQQLLLESDFGIRFGRPFAV